MTPPGIGSGVLLHYPRPEILHQHDRRNEGFFDLLLPFSLLISSLLDIRGIFLFIFLPPDRFCNSTKNKNKKPSQKLKSKFDSDSLEYENELTKYCGVSKKKESKNQAEV